MKNRKALYCIFFVLALTACGGSDLDRGPLPEAFAAVSAGDSRDSLIARLGPPDRIKSTELLALKCEELTWRAGNQVFTVRLIADRVVVKSRQAL